MVHPLEFRRGALLAPLERAFPEAQGVKKLTVTFQGRPALLINAGTTNREVVVR